MKFIVKSASDCVNVVVCNFNTIENLLNFYESVSCDITIKNNLFFNQPIQSIMEIFIDLTEEEAKEIQEIKYEILIYNDWGK